MTAAARRLWLYGLLLLLPALAVGGLALGLLSREHARLAERERAAGETRRAAVEARARLIAENIELLLGDVQAALMATLLEAPAAEPRDFLSEWRANNPLVRDVFRSTADGRPLWGAASDPLREWLAQGPPWMDAASSFASLIASPAAPAESQVAAFAAPGPGASSAAAAAQQRREGGAAQQEARGDISSNVIQYQRARQEIQEVARLRNQSDAIMKATNDARVLGAVGELALAPPPAALPSSSAAEAGLSVRAGLADDFAPAAGSGAAGVTAGDFAFEHAPLAVPELKKSAVEPPAVAPPVVVPEPVTRSGWSPWSMQGGLHLFGWRELPDRTVIGLELRLDAIKSRLGEVFPAATEAGEAYALRDAAGALWHRVGAEDASLTFEVPLASAALPGWSVVADMRPMKNAVGVANGFFALGSALVGLLVLAILASGALLMRQARLSEAEAAQKTSFVANVSHELKTPLTTIRLYAELLAQGRVRDEAKRAGYLATIVEETQRLARLVGNVLDFSRLEQGRKKYELATVDLAAELRRLGETHAPRLAAAGLDLTVEVPGALEVRTDREAVEQIVLNLLDNACKYAAGGCEVLLAAEATGEGGAHVVVADRGPGVPDGQRERIFEKFHRVDDRLTAEKAGAGLGLSIARQLARGLGGELRCEAREGGGAAFVLTLPGAGLTTNDH